jgi:hypothetical protein
MWKTISCTSLEAGLFGSLSQTSMKISYIQSKDLGPAVHFPVQVVLGVLWFVPMCNDAI